MATDVPGSLWAFFNNISKDAYAGAKTARAGQYLSWEHAAKGFDEIGYFAKHWATSVTAEATAASFDDDDLKKWAAAFTEELKKRTNR